MGQYLFQGCINLAEVTLSELPSPRESVLQARVSELTPGCLSSTGITALALPMHFATLGAHACDSCRLLKNIDLCNTQVEEIPEFAFVHCTSLKEVLLPISLHTIRVKAFMNCAALVELAIPPSLRYIGSRAFLDCTVFSRLVKMPRLLTSIYDAALAATKKRVLFSSKTRGVPHVRDHVQPRWQSHSRTNGESILFCIDSSPFMPSARALA